MEIKESFELGVIQQTVNQDQILNLTMANTSLANELNTKQIFVFKKAFSKSPNPKLQRVYFLTVPENVNFISTLQRTEIEKITPINNEVILTSETPPIF